MMRPNDGPAPRGSIDIPEDPLPLPHLHAPQRRQSRVGFSSAYFVDSGSDTASSADRTFRDSRSTAPVRPLFRSFREPSDAGTSVTEVEGLTLDYSPDAVASLTAMDDRHMVHADGSHNDAGGDLRVCGRKLFLHFVRPYALPASVSWKARSLETIFGGLLHSDAVVRRQFLVFSTRSFTTVFAGVLFALGLIVGPLVPLVSRRLTAVWLPTCVPLLACIAVDGALHFFGELSPAAAAVRLATAFVICTVLVGAMSWPLLDAAADCADTVRFPESPGKAEWTAGERLTACAAAVEPFTVVGALCGTLGAPLHPAQHLLLAALFLVLSFAAARAYADVHEPLGELLLKHGATVVAVAAAVAATFLRFVATRVAFEATVGIEQQREETARRAGELHHLLATIVPAAVLPRLAEGGTGHFTIDQAECASMLFADMKGFTAWSSSRTPATVAAMLNTVVAVIDDLATAAPAVEKIKTVGDAYWAVAGIPVPSDDHADELVAFAWRMNAAIADLSRQHPEWDGIQWRVAVHSGPMSGALFGQQQVSYEVFGETARITNVVEATGVAGSVCVTQAVIDAMNSVVHPARVRHHTTIVGQLCNGDSLDVFEIAPPGAEQLQAPPLLEGVSVCDSVDVLGLSLGQALTVVSATTPSHMRSPIHGSSGRTLRDRSHSIPSVVTSSDVTHLTALAEHLRPPSDLKHKASMATSSAGANISVDADAVDALSRPRWRLLPWFADDELELAFKERCEVLTRPMARVMAVACLAAHAVAWVAGRLQSDPCFHTAATVIQCIAAVLLVADVAMCVHPRGPLSCAVAARFGGAALSIIGCGVGAKAGCVAGYDTIWLAVIYTAAASLSVGAVSWPLVCAINTCAVFVPAAVMSALFSPFGAGTVVLGWLAAVFNNTMAFVEEAALRQRFIEEQLSRRCEQQLVLLGEERGALLRRLVPAHVVEDLVEWFGSGMDPTKSIARTYDRVLVAFMQLQPASLEDLPLLHASIDSDLSGGLGGRRMSTASAAVTAPAPVLDKIKTVGDVVMLAGPFCPAAPSQPHATVTTRDSDDVSDDSGDAGHSMSRCSDMTADLEADLAAACAALLALTRCVRQRCPVRVGAHIGPVVGTVQGSSRLGFDAFGDAVNIASRVMTATPAGVALQVTDETRPVLLSVMMPERGVSFGAPSTVEAKGKGTLTVHPVLLQ